MSSSPTRNPSFDIVIIGGGFAGISVAAGLRRRRPDLSVAIVEPSDRHFYQPAWTLVGGGAYDIRRTCRPEAEMIPPGVDWIRTRCVGFQPSQNRVQLAEHESLQYRVLIVAAGLQLDWHRIEGLAETLGRNGVTSNYSYDYAPYTWQCIQGLRGGRAVFTQPAPPFKCAGAPQKILYLAADYWRSKGISTEISFFNAANAMFSVPFFSAALDEVMACYGATANMGRTLVAVDGPGKKAWFDVKSDGEAKLEAVSFDLLHAVPPQSAPTFVRESELVDAAGAWVEVDKHTLRHVRFSNVFSLGDVCSAPTSKTAAAVRGQIPVVLQNVLCEIEGRGRLAQYDGYTSCPLVTSRGRVMLAEFRYDLEVTPSFPLEPRIPRRSYWWLKRYILPQLYWSWFTRGRTLRQTHRPRQLDSALPPIIP